MISIWKKRDVASLLYPFSKIYEWEIGRRNRKFETVDDAVKSLPAKVISVGNITVGGTGKTPLVIALADKLKKRGERVGIISRGYGRKNQHLEHVPPATDRFSDFSVYGDEPLLMASRLKDVPVVVGRDRVAAGEYCIKNFDCETLILDDGYQYRRLHRDHDILVIDATQPFGNGWLLPAGPLREPLSSLGRAGSIVLSRSDAASVPVEEIETRIGRYSKAPVFRAIHGPVCWVSFEGHTELPLQELSGQSCYVFAGIGNPGAFLSTLKDVGVDLKGFSRFRDHQPYSAKDLKSIVKSATAAGARALLTTEKDTVRIPKDWDSGGLPVYALRIEVRFNAGKNLVFDKLVE